MWIIPRIAAIDAVEEQLDSTLVAVVGGPLLSASVAQVQAVLQSNYQVTEGVVQVHRYHQEAFLLIF
jgi:hypothetical protein